MNLNENRHRNQIRFNYTITRIEVRKTKLACLLIQITWYISCEDIFIYESVFHNYDDYLAIMCKNYIVRNQRKLCDNPT